MTQTWKRMLGVARKEVNIFSSIYFGNLFVSDLEVLRLSQWTVITQDLLTRPQTIQKHRIPSKIISLIQIKAFQYM